jgi:hypothetical protein
MSTIKNMTEKLVQKFTDKKNDGDPNSNALDGKQHEHNDRHNYKSVNQELPSQNAPANQDSGMKHQNVPGNGMYISITLI